MKNNTNRINYKIYLNGLHSLQWIIIRFQTNKGRVQPKIEILASFTHLHVVLNLTFFCLWNIKEDILGNFEFFVIIKPMMIVGYQHFSKYVLYSVKDSQQFFYHWFHADGWEESYNNTNTTIFLNRFIIAFRQFLDDYYTFLHFFLIFSYHL